MATKIIFLHERGNHWHGENTGAVLAYSHTVKKLITNLLLVYSLTQSTELVTLSPRL